MDAKQFLAEFGHIVNAPEGIDHLRNLILGLAFRGELTENIASSENKSLDENLLIAKKNEKRLKKNDKGLLEIKESA